MAGLDTVVEIPASNYSLVFNFEKDFDPQDKHQWMIDNWTQCFYYSGLYLAFVYIGPQLMKSRPPYQLRGILLCWNVSLAIFSLMGTWRIVPEFVGALREFGFHHSVCNPSYYLNNKVSAFWTWAFAVSKLAELGDTVFIVLRKQPLLFLHYYHHVTVLSYSWYSCAGFTASGRWFMAMNYTIHSFMYTYYVLKTLRFRIPRPVSMAITIGQLMQMVVGVYLSVWIYWTKASGGHCRVSDENLKISLLMYFSYFLLFVHFFYKAYMNKRHAGAGTGKKIQ